eukprot:1387350-Prymnesium_polylepis.2
MVVSSSHTPPHGQSLQFVVVAGIDDVLRNVPFAHMVQCVARSYDEVLDSQLLQCDWPSTGCAFPEGQEVQ